MKLGDIVVQRDFDDLYQKYFLYLTRVVGTRHNDLLVEVIWVSSEQRRKRIGIRYAFAEKDLRKSWI